MSAPRSGLAASPSRSLPGARRSRLLRHVRLVAIARNEAENLPKLAEAVKGQIDSWLIVIDSRTDDDTESVACDVFAGVPGRVVTSALTAETFRFDAARNEALDLAREDGVHLLLLDVDSPIIGELPDDLTAPVYWCKTIQGGSDWTMPFLIRSDVNASYVFPAHEVLIIHDDYEPVVLDDVYISRTGAGTNPERIAWTIKVLQEEWEQSKDPRAAFYLGNMFRDKYLHDRNNEDRDTAVNWYIERANAGNGWEEEAFLSILRTAELYAFDDPHKGMKCYLEAASRRPQRPEPWFELCRLCNQHGEHLSALAFAEKGLGLPQTTDWLMVARWIASWGLYFEGAVAAWHLGDKVGAYTAFERCLARDDLTPEYRAAAIANLAQRDAPKPKTRPQNNRSRSKKPRR